MKFCFDLDDVIAETYSAIMLASEKFNKDVLKRKSMYRDVTQANGDYFYFAKSFEWDNKDVYRFFHEAYPYFLENCVARTDSVYAIDMLYRKGHKISILSAREERENGIVYSLTEEWLKNNGVKYDELIIDTKKKATIVANNEYDIFVDDSITNCIDVSAVSHCQVHFFRCTYNMGVNINTNSGIQEIHSLKHFLNL